MLQLRGKVPNVDFYSVYPPLNAYIIAVALRALGESIIAYRLVEVTAYVVVVVAIGVFAFRAGRGALLKRTAFVVLLLTTRFSELQSATAIMLLTVATVLTLDPGECLWPRRIRLAAAGLCIGALSMTRLNFALYFGAACVLDGLLTAMGESTSEAWRKTLRDLAFIAVPAMITTLTIVLLWGGDVADLVRQVITDPSRTLIYYAFSPVPAKLTRATLITFVTSGLMGVLVPTAWLAVRANEKGDPAASRMLWLATAAIALLALVLGIWSPRTLPIISLLLVVLLLIARRRFGWLKREEGFILLLFALEEHYNLSRPDWPHFFALLPSVALLWIVGSSLESRRVKRGVLGLLAIVFGPAAAFNFRVISNGALQRHRAIAEMSTLLRSNDDALFGTCGSPCDVYRPNRDELAAAAYVRERTDPSDPVFSGLKDNGRTIWNDVHAYWLMRRPPGTRYLMLQTGASTGPAREADITQDLQSHRVKWLFLWEGEGSELWPGVTREEDSALDRFIRERYRPEASFGSFEIWRAKEP
jgi:hypothetical protein